MRIQYTPCSEAAPLTMATVSDRLPPFLQLRIFPVVSGTKKPAVARWQKPRKTSHGRKRIVKDYITRFPDNPVGIRLGWDYDTLSYLVVIDIDRPDQLTDHQLSVLEKWAWVVWTHRGMHCYGTPPEDMRYAEKKYPWGEYLPGGSFVMAPGTLHPTGSRYDAGAGFGKGPVPRFSAELLNDLGLRNPSPHHLRQPHGPSRGDDYSKPATLAGGSPGIKFFEDLRHAAYRLWPDRQPRPCTLADWTGHVVDVAIHMAENLGVRDDVAVLDSAERVAEWIWDKFDHDLYRSRSPRASAPQSTARYSHLSDAEEVGRIARYHQLKGAENRRARSAPRDEEIRRLAGLGLPQRRIAAQTGIPRSTVQGVLKRTPGIAATRAELDRALR